jgi:hypothetical protein
MLPNCGVSDEMATHSSFPIINHDQYFVFMAATAENTILHKCVATEGCKTSNALSDKLDHSQLKLRMFICITHVFERTITGYVYELLLFTSYYPIDIWGKWVSNPFTF